MERGAIDVASLPGGIDLQATVESGQSYLWDREDGQMYEQTAASGGDAWYWTTLRVDGEPEVVRVRQTDSRLEWEATFDAADALHTLLGLEDDLPAIRETAPSDAVVEEAFDAYWGMRIVRDPAFPTLVSFICSAQMRVARIHGMQQALRREFGEPVAFDGGTYRAFPTPEALAEASEADLRDLSLGYRALRQALGGARRQRRGRPRGRAGPGVRGRPRPPHPVRRRRRQGGRLHPAVLAGLPGGRPAGHVDTDDHRRVLPRV